MKISVANIASGQAASKGDPISLLAGNENFGFATLLDFGGNESGTSHQFNGNRAKQDNSSKGKEDAEDRRSAISASKQSATAVPSGLQSLPCVNAQPWQLNACDIGVRGDASNDSPSSLTSEPSRDAFAVRTPPPAGNARSVDARVLGQGEVADTNTEKATSSSDPSNIEPKKPSEVTAVGNRDVITGSSGAQPNGDIRMPSLAGTSSPSETSVGEGIASLAPTGALVPQREIDTAPAGNSVTQSPTIVVNRQPTTDGKSQHLAAVAGDQISGASGERGEGQARPLAALQSAFDAGSGQSSGGGSTGNGADTRHGSPGAKDTFADSHLSVRQTLQNIGSASSISGFAHGGSVSTNLARSDSAPGSPHNVQLKVATLPGNADLSAARLLGSATRGDLRLGVQTEAFGRVTIQTSAQSGQLSAQLSLENARDSAALAAHLPGVEQKIVEQHGLNASVRLVGNFDGGTGAGSMGREQSGSNQRHTNATMVRSDRVVNSSSNESRRAEGMSLGRLHSVSSRLDVTV